MARQLERTFGGLVLIKDENDNSWLRDSWEFGPEEFAFAGKAHKDSRIGLVHTLPAKDYELWFKTYCISETIASNRRIIVSSNMGYLATSPMAVSLGRVSHTEGVRVAEELKGVEMIDFGHKTALEDLVGFHGGRIAEVPDINPDITIETLTQIYTNLVYKSPRYP